MAENDFLNQSPENYLEQDDFLAYNPEDFLKGEQQVIEETKKENSHLKTEVAIAVGIGVGFLVWVALSKRRLKKAKPQSKDEAYAALKMVWGKTAPAWMQIVTPAIAAAYQVGSNQMTLSDAKLADIAKEYSFNLGHYMNATSDNAIIEGFAAQLNKNVNTSVAWERAVEGYGLDKQQMRSYILQSGAQQAEYQTEAVPHGLKGIVQKLLHGRADKVAKHEAWASMTMGKNVVWLYQQEMGILPPDALKEWITAEDERVCPICAPLDRQQVPISEKFETISGSFWTPAIHVNCRCDIRIVMPGQIEKAIGTDLYDRDEKGRFAAVEERKYAPTPEDEKLLLEVQEWLHQPVEEVNPLKGLKPVANPLRNVNPLRSVNPLAASQVNPLIAAAANPLANYNPLAAYNPLVQNQNVGGGSNSNRPPKPPAPGGPNFETPVSYSHLDMDDLPEIPEMWTTNEGTRFPITSFHTIIDSTSLKDNSEDGTLSDMYSPGISNGFNYALTRALTNNHDILAASADANLRLSSAEARGLDDIADDIYEETLNVRDRTVMATAVAQDYVPTILISRIAEGYNSDEYKITHQDSDDTTVGADAIPSISYNIGRQGVKDYYLSQLRGDEIVWSDHDSLLADAEKSGSSIVKQFPELFIESPWTKYGSVSVWEITSSNEHDGEDEYSPGDEDLDNMDLDGMDIPLDPDDLY